MPRPLSVLVVMAVMPLCLSKKLGAANAVSLVNLHPELTKLPLCAYNCLPLTCGESGLSCLCHNSTRRATDTACLHAHCVFSDALYTKNLTETICDAPVRNRANRFKAMSLALGVTTVVIAVMRLFSKSLFSTRHGFGPDDWAIVAAGIIGIPAIAVEVFGLSDHGLGKDVWTLEPGTVPVFARYFYVMEIMYLVLMTLVKLSLSLFYLDLFPGKTFRRLVLGTIAFHVAFGFTFVVKSLVQCMPLNYTWTQFSDGKPPGGHCINMNASGWANAIINVVVDFWLIAIPLTQLRKLDLHWKKKLAASIMFLTGAIVTLVSILRLRSLIHFANSNNPTWDQWDIAWWSSIEVNVGIICTCLPSLRLILAHIFPRTFGANLGLPMQKGPHMMEQRDNMPIHIDIEQVELCNDHSLGERPRTKNSGSTVSEEGVAAEQPHSALN